MEGLVIYKNVQEWILKVTQSKTDIVEFFTKEGHPIPKKEKLLESQSQIFLGTASVKKR